jgi:hypothetical protein
MAVHRIDAPPDRFDEHTAAALSRAVTEIAKTMATHHAETAGVAIAAMTDREKSNIALALIDGAWQAAAELVGAQFAVVGCTTELALAGQDTRQ